MMFNKGAATVYQLSDGAQIVVRVGDRITWAGPNGTQAGKVHLCGTYGPVAVRKGDRYGASPVVVNPNTITQIGKMAVAI